MNSRTYDALSRITDDEWGSIARRLAHYALGVSRSLRWRTQNAEELPGGETVGSVVSKAIEKLYKGERDWNPETEPNLEKYLQGVIDSLLNHLATSQENLILTAPPDSASYETAIWEHGSPNRDPAADWLVKACDSPEAALIQREKTTIEDYALELLLEECDEDVVLMLVLEAMMDGCDKAAEISAGKGISIKDVYNATKRLDRKLEIVRKRVAQQTTLESKRTRL